ncbi:hypothetical protein QSV37_14840 [Acinetobacter sp. VNK23]|uniref:hypothetical protein n=1 Tax=Acinetobacter thutiue TaxID=2998078 RepID=UPI002577187D|nr:hypothetical protein [Acinetobacter thutiue]MDM1021570.1 hypothetical protein [Acinetobacter thutiue]
MFNNIKLPFGLSLLEMLSIVGFIAIFFSATFKIGYYDGIGLPWLVGTMNPQLILNSSLSFLFLFLPSLIFGWFLIFIPKKKYYNSLIVSIPYIFTLVYFLIKSFTPKTLDLLVDNFSFTKTIEFYIIFSSLFSGILLGFTNTGQSILSLSNRTDDLEEKKALYLLSALNFLLVGMILISTPYGLGKFIGKRALENFEPKNKIELSDSKQEWYILELISDKALIYEKNNKIFKIIELKDISQIKYNDDESSR